MASITPKGTEVTFSGAINVPGAGIVRFRVYASGAAEWEDSAGEVTEAALDIRDALAQVVYDKCVAEPFDAEADDDDDSASEYVHEFKAQP